MKKIDGKTLDLVKNKKELLIQMFPEYYNAENDTFNIDELCCELNGNIHSKERYELTWPGKTNSILHANSITTSTLRPCRDASLNFDETENVYIEGDNLEALKILQESYLGKIKCIYIDPPYNTGNDFIYNDNYSKNQNEELEESGQVDELNNRLISNSDTSGRFHSDWLSMMYSRLKLARNLLKEDGVIFISIDDNEQANLKKICDEIFGENNFIGVFCINSTPNARDYGHIGKMHEYALFYAKSIDKTITYLIPDEDKKFSYEDEIGGFNIHPLYNSNEAFTPKNRPNLYYPFYVNPDKKIENDFYEISLEYKDGYVEVYPPKSLKNNVQFVWRWGKEEKARENLNKEIIGYKVDNEFRIVQKMRNSAKIIRSFLYENNYTSRRGTAELEGVLGRKVFSFPKPCSLIKLFLKASTTNNDIVLDFFSGSGTTAQAVLELNNEDNMNRKYILIQIPEKIDDEDYDNLCDIAIDRIKKIDNKKGFRVYKVDSSNMKDVYYEPNKVDQQTLANLESNIKEDRTPEDLLTQVILDLGLTLDLKIEEKEVLGNKVFFVEDNALVACFDDNINEELIDEIAKVMPLKVVLRDSSFDNDSAKINFMEGKIKEVSPDTEICVL